MLVFYPTKLVNEIHKDNSNSEGNCDEQQNVDAEDSQKVED